MRQVLCATLVAGFCAVIPVPALAANQNVGVRDDFFDPSRVAVMPGESVTWTNPGSGEEHNVRFEDKQAAELGPSNQPWTASRTFPTSGASGAFPFFCEIHGAPGGIGMAGVVYVNSAANLPPIARLTVSPGVALPGQPVSFRSESSDTGGSITKYEWDLDGNGSFETDTGATPTAPPRSYASPATLTIKLRVTDNQGFTGEATQPLKINAPPTASFTATPNSVQAGQTLTFDASASSDSDGTIVQYEWDLDGNGSLETNTGTTPTVSQSYSSPATLTVKLRVTDSDGASAETTRSLQIDPAPPPPAPPAPPPPTPLQQPTPAQQQPIVQQPTSQPTSKPQSPTRKGRPGKCSKLKGKKRAACIKKSCRKLKGSKKRACVKKVTRRS